MKTKKLKYVHDEVSFNMVTPNIVVPIVLTMLPPVNSVVDFGCGIGRWLKAFKNCGVGEILGLDGEWCNKELLLKHIDKNEFRCVDLEYPIHLDKTYDLVISLEVAEHLSEWAADAFVQSLVDAGKIILFSAAVPGQDGLNHINEQWPSYWENKFQQHGYKCYDLIRRKMQNDSKIQESYKQNMFFVIHRDCRTQFEMINNINIEEGQILPWLYPFTSRNISKILQGERGISFYFRLLMKSVINKFKFNK
jgi:SAM-dependent methyltransferase